MDRTFPGNNTTKWNGDKCMLQMATPDNPTHSHNRSITNKHAPRAATKLIIANGIDSVSVRFLTKVDCQSGFPRNTKVRVHAPLRTSQDALNR